MGEEKEIITRFSEYLNWLREIEKIDESKWSEPIAKGKWSVSEIIGHIMYWDRYLITEVLSSIRQGNEITFPEFDSFNHQASFYVRSGGSQAALIKEAIEARGSLVKGLYELPTATLKKQVTVNGVADCPHTGNPYTLLYIVEEFIEHDHHHQKQVERSITRHDSSFS
ncbi:DinB family protein [Bacillus carboniphilus]|uniref:DinB family protein n=1 Tax=Bacillus carboniphilus TaxID=86663 RepID=A0ABY9JXD0_9BACI|nr:DinB family protein [Bacillus carboniphilus]WLR42331.1 DinB family protein [Bacillus carboniphilus]